MKKLIMKLLVCTMVILSLVVSVFAVEVDGEIEENWNLENINISEEMKERHYQAALAQTVAPISEDGTEVTVSNGGLVVYSNGYAKQTILVQEKSNDQASQSNQVKVSTIDHWQRLFDADDRVCRVMITCTFTYDMTVAKPETDTYEFSYYIYPDYRSQTYVTEKKVSFKNGYGGSPTGRVDTDYQVNFNVLWDNETISISCDKDGTVTRYGEHESI